MRVLFYILVILLMSPAQVPATGLQLFKPKVKEVTVAPAATRPAMFTRFQVKKNGDQAEWSVTVMSRTGQNMPRNHYNVRVFQLDIGGNKMPAGEPFTVTKDIRPNTGLDLSGTFTPGRQLAKLQFELYSRSDGTILGLAAFDAQSVANTPGNQASQAVETSGPAASQFGSGANEMMTPLDIRLQLKQLDRNKFELQATNAGAGKIDLRHYLFSVTSDMLMRPDYKTVFSFDATVLDPGRSAKSRPQNVDGTMCANLDSFTLVAKGRSSHVMFETVQPVEAVDLSAQPVSIELKQMDRGIDEYSSVELVFDVRNQGERIATDAELSGKLFFKAKSVTAPEFFLDLDRISAAGFPLLPGQKKRMHFLIRVGTLADHGTMAQEIYTLHGKKPLVIEFKGYLGNPSRCGVPVRYDDVQIRQEFTKVN